ncbi:MAG TPA: DUF4129 domain-containing protein [Jiangellales bacterium]|nr:DUF4129 domain-containing protein [Jiangellales bacterium]
MSGVPVELGRDEARLRARAELADPSYDADPSLLERVVAWVLEQLGRLVDASAGVSPGAWVGLGLLLAMLLLGVLVVRHQVGPLARSARRGDPVFGSRARRAVEHRVAADEAAKQGDWARAVVERYRAVVRGLEERAVLDPRPGRTADEAAREAGTLLSDLAADLLAGARLFDAVRYGGHPCGAHDHERLRALDDAVRRTRPVAGSSAAQSVPVPR